MNAIKRILIDGLVGLAVVAGIAGAMAMLIAAAGKAAYAGTDGIVLDYNEQTHLEGHLKNIEKYIDKG